VRTFLYFRSALHTFASRFAGLIDLDSLTADDSGGLAFVQVLTGLLFGGLDSFDAFGGLDILAAFADLNSLEALGLDTLDALNCFSSLVALQVLAAEIAKLLLKLGVLELHAAVMRRIKFPVLELAPAADVHLVEFAVEHGVCLDRRKSAVPPIVVVPQCRADEERCAEANAGPTVHQGGCQKKGTYAGGQ